MLKGKAGKHTAPARAAQGRKKVGRRPLHPGKPPGAPARPSPAGRRHARCACITVCPPGPPLDALSTRRYLDGVLPNEPENLVRFILDPKKYHPGGAMPKVVEHEQDVRDIAAYLYTLR